MIKYLKNKVSVEKIIRSLIEKNSLVFGIQRELIENRKHINEIRAGKLIYDKVDSMKEECE